MKVTLEDILIARIKSQLKVEFDIDEAKLIEHLEYVQRTGKSVTMEIGIKSNIKEIIQSMYN